MTRTKRRFVTSPHAFELKAIGRVLPAGDYEVIVDEELIDGISFPVYRRVASWIMVPGTSRGSTEMVMIDGADIAAALSSACEGGQKPSSTP